MDSNEDSVSRVGGSITKVGANKVTGGVNVRTIGKKHHNLDVHSVDSSENNSH